jgi:protease I
MAESNIKGMHVAILATDGFEQAELTEPKKALEEAGAITTILAPQGGDIQGMRHHDKSEKVTVEQTLDEADPSRFDAVLLPGGALNADALRVIKKAQEFIQEMDHQHKPVAVICHGPGSSSLPSWFEGARLRVTIRFRMISAMPAGPGRIEK